MRDSSFVQTSDPGTLPPPTAALFMVNCVSCFRCFTSVTSSIPHQSEEFCPGHTPQPETSAEPAAPPPMESDWKYRELEPWSRVATLSRELGAIRTIMGSLINETNLVKDKGRTQDAVRASKPGIYV